MKLSEVENPKKNKNKNMKYLSNYKIFLEKKEETKTTDQTTKEPNDDLESGIKPPSYYEGENKKPEETGPTENPGGASNVPPGDSKKDNSNQQDSQIKPLSKDPTDKEVSEILQKIVQKINTAFDASRSGYYFRKHVHQYAFRGTRMFKGGDNEEEAIIDFLGHTWQYTESAAKNWDKESLEQQHRSWWYINVFLVLQHVEEESIVKSGEDDYLQKVKNDLKRFNDGEIWTLIRDGLKKRKNTLDVIFQSFNTPIDIVPDIGHGPDEGFWKRRMGILPRPQAKNEELEKTLELEGDNQTIKKTNDIIPLFEKLSKDVDGLKSKYQDKNIPITHENLKEFYNISHDILCIFDYIFRRCENCFEKHKGYWFTPDDEIGLRKQLRGINDAHLLPLLTKINKILESLRTDPDNNNSGLNNSILHLKRENDRIKDKFLPALYKNLGESEVFVQFQINTWDKNERILISIYGDI